MPKRERRKRERITHGKEREKRERECQIERVTKRENAMPEEWNKQRFQQ